MCIWTVTPGLRSKILNPFSSYAFEPYFISFVHSLRHWDAHVLTNNFQIAELIFIAL